MFFGYEKHTRPKKRADIYQKLKKAGIIEAKNLVDLQRSSGGFFKVIFSFGMLFAVFYFMLELFPVFNLFLRTPVMVLGILLGMASLSVYNWLNRFDSKEDYLFLPLTEEELLRSKVRSFYILVVPIILLVETAAFILLNSSLLGLFHGIVAGLVSSSYILAVAVTLTGMKPNTMLFDSGKLVKFVFYSSLLFVPLLILSISIVSSPIYSSVFALALYTAGAVVVWKEVFRRLG
ncbi:MAG: hypothetical protein MUP58_03160 [Candidatus Nanohaloarchaeota archaeon QJJ-9]|nr:hypothetical protein [Candidatus Nanohaloarchaeota archaeon QJJ-9]